MTALNVPTLDMSELTPDFFCETARTAILANINQSIDFYDDDSVKRKIVAELGPWIRLIETATTPVELRAVLENKYHLQQATLLSRDAHAGTRHFTQLRQSLTRIRGQISDFVLFHSGQDEEAVSDLEHFSFHILEGNLLNMLEDTTLNLADDYFLDVYDDNLTNDEKAAAALDFLREFARAVLRDDVKEEDLSAFEPFTVNLLTEFLNNFNALCPLDSNGNRDLSNLKTLGLRSKEDYLVNTIRQRYQSFDEGEAPVLASSVTVTIAVAEVLSEEPVADTTVPDAPVLEAELEVQGTDEPEPTVEEATESEVTSLDPLQKLKVLMAKVEEAIRLHGPRKSRGFASKILVAANALIEDAELSIQAKQAIAILIEPICDHGSITVNDRSETSFALSSGLKDVDFRAVLGRFLSVLFPEGGAGEISGRDLMNLKQTSLLLSNFATSNVWFSEDDSIRYEVQMGKAVKEMMKTLANPKQNAAYSLDQAKAIQAFADFLLKNLYTYRDKTTKRVSLRTNAALHKKPEYLRDTLREVVVPPVNSDVLTTIDEMSARLRALLDEREDDLELAMIKEELSGIAPSIESIEKDRDVLLNLITDLEKLIAKWSDNNERHAVEHAAHLAQIKEIDKEVKALGSKIQASGGEVGPEVVTSLMTKMSDISALKVRCELIENDLQASKSELDLTVRIKHEKLTELNAINEQVAQLTTRRTNLVQQISVIERARAAKEANIRAVRARLTSLVAEVDSSLASTRELLSQ